jgi:hypothetical protein
MVIISSNFKQSLGKIHSNHLKILRRTAGPESIKINSSESSYEAKCIIALLQLKLKIEEAQK